jgi:hypothetical protein
MVALHEDFMRVGPAMTSGSSAGMTPPAARGTQVRPLGHPRIVTAADDG